MTRSSMFIAALLAAFGASIAQAQQATPAAAAPVASASADATATAAAPLVADSATVGTTTDALVITDKKVGSGKEATPGSTVRVHYTGWLYRPQARLSHGKMFDTSRGAGRGPIEFQLGVGQVIKGWDQGVAGMKIGGKRTLTIPSALGYGPKGTPGGEIPPNSTLIFDVELMGVK